MYRDGGKVQAKRSSAMLAKLCHFFGKKISANLTAVSFGTVPHGGKFFSTVADSHAMEVTQRYFIKHCHKIAAAIVELIDRNEKLP